MERRLRAVLEREPAVAYALLFGSAARGALGPLSDVDVAVGLSTPLDVERLGLLAADLEAAAGRPVDVVLLDEAGLPLAFRVFREGRLLLCRDREAFVARKARAIVEYLDFQPVEAECVEGVLRAARGR